jgi:NTP pyrophosphatase (non-canonical NTP hydrolase)
MTELLPIENAIIKQNQEIEIFSKDTPSKLIEMVLEETQELKEAIDLAFVNDDTTSVASEIGDVFYLMIRLCDELGINWREATQMKVMRNEVKYKGQIDCQTAKENWNGGDALFFQTYLNTLANLTE